ncbi:hypothetical protein [Kitasatospora sp. NPDC056731]
MAMETTAREIASVHGVTVRTGVNSSSAVMPVLASFSIAAFGVV